MLKCALYLYLISATAIPVAWGQLHLIAGAPNEGYNETYAAELLRVEDDGKVALVSELVPKSPGAAWINISYDLRKAVVETGYPESALLVVDFNSASVVKKCKISEDPGGRRGFGAQWLLNSPAYGPSFEWIASSSNPKDSILRGMLLDPAVSCQDSFANRSAEEVRYALKNGDVGPGDVTFSMGMQVVVDDSPNDVDYGRVSSFVGKHVPLGYTIPRALLISTEWRYWLDIIDSHVFCISAVPRGSGTERNYRVWVFRKSDASWHVLPTSSELSPRMRGFGRYIAITQSNATSTKNPRSKGHEKWRKGARRTGPDLRERMDNPDVGRVYPGNCEIYDVETNKLFTITTDQADSEVLLVENGFVYYRVLNQLYTASISDQGIGTPRLLATDDAILDAHWAFMKR